MPTQAKGEFSKIGGPFAPRLIEMLRAYRAAAMALPDAVVVLDRNSQRVQWFNPAATTLLGLHYPRDIGAPLGDRLHAMSLARWLAAGRNAEPLMDADALAESLGADPKFSLLRLKK